MDLAQDGNHVGSRDKDGEAEKGEGKQELPGNDREQPDNPPKETDQGEGADAGNAHSARFRPAVPAALDAHQQADGEREADSLEQLDLAHAGDHRAAPRPMPNTHSSRL